MVHLSHLFQACIASRFWAGYLVLGLGLLSGCDVSVNGNRPEESQDPQNIETTGVSDALTAYFVAQDAPLDSAYQVDYLDLDGDRIPDALVLLQGPFWCGLRGCPLLVFRGVSDNVFVYLSRIEPVREPILLGDRRTNGWRDLIVSTTVAERPEDVRLNFVLDGYPSQASSGEVVRNLGALQTERVFAQP